MSQASAGRSVMVQGRIVWIAGSGPDGLFKGKVKTEFGSQTPKRNQQGETMMEYGFGLAVSKASLGQAGPGQPGEIWGAIHEEAYLFFPNRIIPPSFAMKYKDGDTAIDEKGVPYNQREGYAGHLVFSCTTSLPIKFFKWENGANILISEGIKCGDYVNVQLQIKAHPAIANGKAGLYLNPNAVQFLGFGKEIINAPSGDQIFGQGAPPQMGSATPIAPMPGMLLPNAPPALAPPMPPAAPAYAPPPAAPPQPHYGVVPPIHQPPPGGMPAAAPPYAPPPGYAPPPAAPMGYPPPAAAPMGYPAPAAPAYQPPGMPPMPGGYPVPQ